MDHYLSFRLGRINLSHGVLERVSVPDDLHRLFVGGAGLAAALLFPVLLPDLDPCGEEAPLLLAAGPLTGTHGPSVGRLTICGKSPATNLWAESNIGGNAGFELRKAGLDGLWITGKAERPVYLWFHDGEIEVRDASHMWGVADTYQTQSIIQEELGERGASILSIGRGGENLLPFALVLCDHGRVAGRTGMGAVMGGKNLKAIAIRGSGQIPLVNTDKFSLTRSRVNRELRADLVSKGLRDFGTASGSDIFDYFGMMPKKYFSEGTLDGTESVSGPTLSETLLSGVSTCHGCVIACGRKVRLKDGVERKGPEYETTIGFGPNLGILDLTAITLMGDRCDQLGLDSISFSNTLAMATYFFEEGLIDISDTGGESLKWGDTDTVLRLIDATANREGFGARLALGSRQLAEEVGYPGLAMEVKGLEIPYHDPRGATGVGLVYATSPRGACHNQSHYYLVEMGQTMESIGVGMLYRHEVEEKPAMVARHQDWTSLLNSLVQCIFANVPPVDTLDLLNQATGWDFTLEGVLLAGERIWNIKRLLNMRLGADRSDDRLPEPLLEPLREGGGSNFIVPLDSMLRSYYLARGWDPERGTPTLETRQRLQLDHFPSTES